MEAELDKELREAFDRVFNRSRYIEGVEDEAFEKAFADYCAISADDVYNRLLDFAKDCKNVFGLEVTVTPKKFVYTEKDVEKDEDIEQKEGAEHENEPNNN